MRELFVSMMKLLAWLSLFVPAICGQIIGIQFMDGPNSWMGFFGFGLGLGVGVLCWVLFTGLADLSESIWGNEHAVAIRAKNERAAIRAELELAMNERAATHTRMELLINKHRDKEAVSLIQRFHRKPTIECKVLNQVRAYMRQQYIEGSQKEHVTEENIRKFAAALYYDSTESRMEDFERLYALGVLDLAGVYCLLAAYHGEVTCQMAKVLGVPEEMMGNLSKSAKDKVQHYLDGFSTPEPVVLVPEPLCTIDQGLLLREIYHILDHAI